MTATGLLGGADILIGMGMLNSANALCLPKLLLDAELWGACRRFARGIELDDEHLMLDVIERVGPGGHYLSAKETSADLRAGEHWRPDLYRRVAYESWQAARAPTTSQGATGAAAGPPAGVGGAEWAEAVERVEAILAAHQPPPLPGGTEAAMADVVAAAVRELPA